MIIPKMFVGTFNRTMSYGLLKICNYRRIDVNGNQMFRQLIASNHKFLIVSNHVSLYDGFILLATLGEVSFLAHPNGISVLPGMREINKKLGSVFLDKQKGNTQSIIDHINKRKHNDNALVVFPDGMAKIPKNTCIAPFKTGAFVGKFDVLPVVIKYKNNDIDPSYQWYNGEGPFISFFKMLLDGKCDIVVDVMDIQSCRDRSIEEYRDDVYKLMCNRYNDL